MRFLPALFAVAAAFARAQTPDGATHADWPHYGGTQLSWRYSALDQVNTGNVKNLVPVCIFQTGDYAENLQATPIVVEGNRGSAVAYSIAGRQYIATPTGWQQAITGAQLASVFPDQNWRAGSTLIVFALPEVSQ
jgi:glucose dehydrogenase